MQVPPDCGTYGTSVPSSECVWHIAEGSIAQPVPPRLLPTALCDEGGGPGCCHDSGAEGTVPQAVPLRLLLTVVFDERGGEWCFRGSCIV